MRSLSRRQPLPFDIAPEPDEKPAIAGFLGIQALRELSFRGEITPVRADEWRIDGRLEASVVQICVVTLAPMTGRIDETVSRTYMPEERFALPAAIDLDPDTEDDPDPYGTTIDPGLLAVDSLVLSLDPYPRAPGVPTAEVEAAPPGAAPIADTDLKPFAKLAVLKQKLGGGGPADD